MQPYFFPYIGYFQLIKAVDKFVFYDDVNFIKNGWINRNRILLNGEPHYMTVELKDASPFKLIKDIQFTDNRPKLKKTIEHAYKKAPYFEHVWPLVADCLTFETHNICDLAVYSVEETCKYLGINTPREVSSKLYAETKKFDKEKRIKEICKANNVSRYVNPIGGMELYKKESFTRGGIRLDFIRTEEVEYKQNVSEFVPDLSIIDVMMFNSKKKISKILEKYELV
jgi:hypothetical protein